MIIFVKIPHLKKDYRNSYHQSKRLLLTLMNLSTFQIENQPAQVCMYCYLAGDGDLSEWVIALIQQFPMDMIVPKLNP